MARIPLKGRALMRLKKRRKTIRTAMIVAEIVAGLLILALILPVLLKERVRGDVTVPEIRQALESVTYAGEADTLKQPGDAMDVRRIYRINDPAPDSFYVRLPESNMDVTEEIFLIAENEESAEDYLVRLEQRLDSRKRDFESYGTDQMKLLDSAVIERKGKYVFLIISPKAEEKKSAILDVIN